MLLHVRSWKPAKSFVCGLRHKPRKKSSNIFHAFRLFDHQQFGQVYFLAGIVNCAKPGDFTHIKDNFFVVSAFWIGMHLTVITLVQSYSASRGSISDRWVEWTAVNFSQDLHFLVSLFVSGIRIPLFVNDWDSYASDPVLNCISINIQ
jgi:hypothetical protein